MRRKLFISINIPPKARHRLIEVTQKWHDLPVKWVKEENLHVTLFFLGYVDDDSVGEICQKTAEAVKEEEIFDIYLDRIELAPSEKEPRLIWLTGEPSEPLRRLHEKIEKELGMFTAEKKTFRPHVTIGRIRRHKWEDLEETPSINEEHILTAPVETVDVMASHFGDGEHEYTLIEACPLK